MVSILRTLQLVTAAGALLALGCAPADSARAETAEGVENLEAGLPGSSQNQTPSLATTRLLERMAAAHEGTRYSGVRHVEQHYTSGGQAQLLEYREEVACDGEGRFAIEVLDVQAVSGDEALFRTLQNSRQVFTFKYRDFRVTDLTLFRQNYRMRVLSTDQQIAGHPCLEMRVDRHQHDGSYYRIHVEPQSGLTLRWEQRTDRGALLGSMEFESIDFDPDLSNYLLVERNFEGSSVDIDLNLGGQIGFGVLTPNLLPTGFELETAQLLVGALDRTWFKRVYTDGVSRLALMHREQEPIDGPSDERNLGRVLSTQIGSWNVVSGNLQGWDLILMGQVDADELYQMLQSSF